MKIDKQRWQKAQADEIKYWSIPNAMIVEENKQLIYFHYMGIKSTDMEGKSVLDLGGGMCSFLLKCKNYGRACVVDPIIGKSPQWVIDRYHASGITLFDIPAEDFCTAPGVVYTFDEVWIYNVLQHVLDPEAVVNVARKYGKIVRVFEHVNEPTDSKHPHVLTKELLDGWLGGSGTVEMVDTPFYKGESYYGDFTQV